MLMEGQSIARGGPWLASHQKLHRICRFRVPSARRNPTRRSAGLLFHYSLLYLALLFVAMAVDPLF